MYLNQGTENQQASTNMFSVVAVQSSQDCKSNLFSLKFRKLYLQP